jgi:predicted lipid-binding transport protein (Tim44 family)
MNMALSIDRRRDAGDQKIEDQTTAQMSLSEVLKRICVASRYANVDQFLDGARLAYETILEGFAQGDIEPLTFLLAADVYEDFARVIAARNECGERVELMFVGVSAADVVHAELADGRARIVVRFVGHMVSATYDGDGRCVAGHPARVEAVPELWTFERELRCSRPDWILVGTESDE